MKKIIFRFFIYFIVMFCQLSIIPVNVYSDDVDICIDPGHGGCDVLTAFCGAATYIDNPDENDCCPKYSEKHVNLQVALNYFPILIYSN